MEREEGKSGRQTMVSDLIQSVSQSVNYRSIGPMSPTLPSDFIKAYFCLLFLPIQIPETVALTPVVVVVVVVAVTLLLS